MIRRLDTLRSTWLPAVGLRCPAAASRPWLLTDVATGWTECVPILLRESGLVTEAIGKARTLFPFPRRGVDFDNDGVFMNEAVIGWCRDAGLEVTRARADRKNDQAWVEQKNGAIVRWLIGYGRFEGFAAAQALLRLYAAPRLHSNVFQPSLKLHPDWRTDRQACAAQGETPCAGSAPSRSPDRSRSPVRPAWSAVVPATRRERPPRSRALDRRAVSARPHGAGQLRTR
jgi:hypothetical protein